MRHVSHFFVHPLQQIPLKRDGQGDMRIATYRWGGRRHVGVLSNDAREITPIDLKRRQEQVQSRGAQALLEHLAEGNGFLRLTALACRSPRWHSKPRSHVHVAIYGASAVTIEHMRRNCRARYSRTTPTAQRRLINGRLSSPRCLSASSATATRFRFRARLRPNRSITRRNSRS